MNDLARNWILPALPGLWLLAGCLRTAPPRPVQPPIPLEASLQAGAAEIDITPPVGVRMAGYFNERLATGTHDPLHAKALVLRQGAEPIPFGHRAETIAFVSCDLLGIPLEVTTKARDQASQRTGIPRQNIVICATHSHTGPLFEGALRDYLHAAAEAKYSHDPHESGDYPAMLVERLVKVIVAAQAHLRPAQVQAGVTTQTGLAFNRRYWMKNGKVVFNPGPLNPDIVRPAGPTDSDVGIVLARDEKTGHPVAGLTVFGMHSDTVGGTLYSADYEYYLEQTLQAAFGKHFISVFGLGPCGDINHIDVTHKAVANGFPLAARLGDTLGRAVLSAAPGLPIIDKPALAVRSATLQVPLQEVTAAEVADARAVMERLGDTKVPFLTKVAAVKTLDLAKRGPTWPMEVQVFRLDARTAIVCLPCEIFVELGLAIKRASPFPRTLVISVCNDRPSYVPTLKAFSEGSYEVTNARVKPGAGEMLVEAAVKLLGSLKSE
jgi:hypothetical protein